MNNSVEYILGELTADMKDVKEHIEKMEIKLDNLNVWRWKTTGIVIGGSVIVQFGVYFLTDVLIK